MQKLTIREFTSKFSKYHRRMKEGEVFEVNGMAIGSIACISKDNLKMSKSHGVAMKAVRELEKSVFKGGISKKQSCK